ncbi:nitrate- and nitrite sensing domain-containing protein [Streptomyces sp. NPDC006384]|uniref:sensor histidine kinase n=1 Tax=Streptomyces sp. NPDC006384 TaxID=3364745 RepID=UPI0036AF3D8A
MHKTRPRRTGKQTAPTGSAERPPGTSTTPVAEAPPVGRGRPTHVRNRLIVAVAVVAAAVAGAGAPSVVAASGQLHDSQELVTLAEQTQDALALAHALADERDEVTPYIAAGRPRSEAPSEQRGARVDRQVEELLADTDTPASLREDLEAVAALRRAALSGRSTALQAHDAYSDAIAGLHALAERLAERTPPRAGAGAHALAELDTAVQQAAATRGLLLAALGVPSSTETVIDPVTGLPTEAVTSSDADAEQRDALTAAAQQARVRSDAALAGFRETAPKEARDSFDATVTGPEVNSAEKYLAGLTDRPTLSDAELATSAKKLDAALSARVDAMRGAESALYGKRTEALERLRDDDVTALEIRVAVLGALLLATIGIATAMARTLTRPLSVLRRGSARLAGAADPAAEAPVAFTGRNDEFAQVVRSVNALHAHAVTLAERVTTLEADRKHLVGQRQKMADAREELRAELAGSTARLEAVRKHIGSTFVNLALRTLGLVERQLAVIEDLEQREQDPDRLATLFKLDHFATVMRRHNENLLVLAGTEHHQHSAGPVPLVDVVRAAVSEIERYERVRIAALPPHAHVAGFAADDLSHLLAELLENATSFSPPDLPVEVSGWLLESGEVMLSVQDEGIGMATERLQRLNARLTDFDPDAPYEQEGEDGLGLGLYVVARLAHRHGVRVRLREQKQGGVAAVVVLPNALLAAAPPAALAPAAPPSDGTGSFTLPGADAEANSNVLPGRAEKGVRRDADPLVASAEQAVHRAETAAAAAAEPEADAASSADPATPPTDDTGAAIPDTDTAGPVGLVPDRAEPAGSTAADGTADPADGPATGPVPPAGETTEPGPGPGTAVPAGPAQPEHAGAPAEPAPAPASGPREHVDEDTRERADENTRPADTPAEGPQPAGDSSEAASPAPEPDEDRAAPAASGVRDFPDDTTMELLLPAQSQARPEAPAPASASGTARQEPHDTPEAPEPAPARQGPRAPERPDPAGPRTIGPDAHERSADESAGPEPAGSPVTAKGLPKRTPKLTTPATVPGPRTAGSVDAEALRRRLGGFRRGAEAGRRDVEAEITGRTDRDQAPPAAGTTEEATGGTVEEASS